MNNECSEETCTVPVMCWSMNNECSEETCTFHSADSDSDHIRTYLWPALLQGPGASLTTFPDRRLMLQSPSYVLEYEQRVFRRDLHVRFHSADSDSDHIRTYLWPALLQGPGGQCVHKAVVIT
ncbi:hypothetical protein J6590_072342 [Homalodisca vitripennis]|nr:hypothetical protein J6590_072342 [Homalodisca vitripennis]